MEVKNVLEKSLHVYWVSSEGTLYHYIFKPGDYRKSGLGKVCSYVINANICFTKTEHTYRCLESDLNKFKNDKLYSFDVTDNHDAMQLIRKHYEDKIDELNKQLDKLYAARGKLG